MPKLIVVSEPGVWQRGSGEHIAIAEMTIMHVKGAIRLVDRKIRECEYSLAVFRRTQLQMPGPEVDKAIAEVEPIEKALRAKRAELLAEIEKR